MTVVAIVVPWLFKFSKSPNETKQRNKITNKKHTANIYKIK